MGKPTAKKKKSSCVKSSDGNSKSNRSTVDSSKVFDHDAAVFMDMANALKEEGNILFQKRDYDGAFVKYQKAIELIPNKHVDAACLHSNIASCYMQMGPEYYPKAIHECNLALQVSPKYTKALLKRAKCFDTLNRFELASKDVDAVLSLEPNNLTALEISEKIKNAHEVKGIQVNIKEIVSPPEIIPATEKPKKKKRNKTAGKVVMEEKAVLDTTLSQKPIADMTIAENPKVIKEKPTKALKLVFGDDIRFARIPENCSMSQLREIVRSRFPSLKAVLIKYKDKEGDLVTITTSEELDWVEDSADLKASVRLYITEVKPEQEPLFDDKNRNYVEQGTNNGCLNYGNLGVTVEQKDSCCINEWILEFAQLFKNHVGVDCDPYLDLHQIGMKLYSEAMEDTVTSEEAMEIFELASEKFQEMAALALFNWGNVFMSRARKRIHLVENNSKEVVLAQVKSSYEWAKEQYKKAKSSYAEAMKIKPDFYEGFLALAHQQFEQAKLTWYFALGSKVDLDTWPSNEVLELLNDAEENMEKGTETWEEIEEQRLKARLKPNKEKVILEKMGLGRFFQHFSADEAAESSAKMRCQMHILWGRILFERSTVEFKLSLPTWEECLMAAVEKFKLAGASPADIAVIIKNHCANETTQEGLGFKIDEIIQAWNEMYDAKRWLSDVPSFRLEPLFRRRVPKLHQSLEHA